MLLLIGGIAVFAVTCYVFWILRPSGEKLHRWADTEWEPYISVALCSGVALSFTMMLSAIINLASTS